MLLAHGHTHPGRRRRMNEDRVFCQDGLLVVCDGMGGHQAGEVASQLAVETIARFVERSGADRELTWPYGFDPRFSYDENRLRTAIKLANRAVFRQASSADSYTGMGTTVVAALLPPDGRLLTYGSVGDSRLYLVRGGAIIQLTRDDSWANLLRHGGAPEATNLDAMQHVLTKALGARDDVEFEVMDHPLAPGDTLLLCSDGLTNMLSDERILGLVSAGGDLAATCQALIDGANAEGGHDNVSVVLARLIGRRPDPP